MRKYWDDVNAGKVEHNGRGPDKKPRANTGTMKSFEKRYYESTGRRIQDDMREQQEEIQLMKQIAMAMGNDPAEQFKLLKEVNSLRDKYNRQWAPYLQGKKGMIENTAKEDEYESLDDILSGDLDETY